VELLVTASGEKDADQWTTAGIRDCWLGGSQHTAFERELADRILVGTPQLPYLVRIYRALLSRIVHHLADEGVHQFLDLGSGLPTAGNVHQVAQRLDPSCRVIYVDNNPHVVARSHTLLTGNDNAAVICADLRRPEQVYEAAEHTKLFNWETPVAVLLIDILHHIPDVNYPAGFINAYVDLACPGSYLAIAHTTDDQRYLETGLAIFRKLYRRLAPPLNFRNPIQAADFFKGLNIIEPGIVPVPLWHPASNEDLDSDPGHFPAWCGLGRKP
jgi:hypothetical protein